MAPVTRMRGGLDLGGTKIQAVVTDGEAKVLGKARRETPQRGGPEAVVLELAETLREALDDARRRADGSRRRGSRRAGLDRHARPAR